MIENILYNKLIPQCNKGKQPFVEGLSNWYSISRLLIEHETSRHLVSAMCTFIKRRSSLCRVDAQLVTQFEKQCSYWRLVLQRLVATVKLLGALSLGFKYHDDS